MDIFKRSFLNLLRNPGRTALVVIILALCLGLGLSMFAANSSADSQLGAVSGKIGTGKEDRELPIEISIPVHYVQHMLSAEAQKALGCGFYYVICEFSQLIFFRLPLIRAATMGRY